jgi:hypothetical protein
MTTTTTEAAAARGERRSASSVAFWGGILFALLFSGLIWWAGRRLASVPHLPDTGPSWYYWKLPAPTLWGRVTAWGFYALHQIAVWALIAVAQKRRPGYTAGLHRFNVLALGVNAAFILLHFLQTHVWYDGLAQDVSIWTSQGSVILMLVVILLMENRRRGMFFGKPAPLPERAADFARRYHGYVFAWATVYTFWYHPMEPTSGHVIGFFYMFLLFLQGSLFFTRTHINRRWTFVLETTVLVHGTLVAVMQGNGLWPMFAFGFGGILVITQMHGLRLSRWVRGAILAVYIGAALLVYSQRGWLQLNEIVRIPLIEYALVFALAWLIAGGLWLWRRLGGSA